MCPDNSESDNSYVERAVESFNEAMKNNQLGMVEKMNRANKGELFVLHFLSVHNDAALPSELSAALHSSTGRISALLGTLEKKGFIERNIDKTNRRNILVTITEAGCKHAEMEFVKIRDNMTKVFAEMGETDAFEYIRLSKRFFTLSQKYMNEFENSDQ